MINKSSKFGYIRNLYTKATISSRLVTLENNVGDNGRESLY